MSEQDDVMAELQSQHKAEDVEGVEAPKRDQIAAGKASFRIDNIYLNRSQKGRKQLTAVCEITDHAAGPDAIGSMYYKMWGLETPQNLSWLKGDLTNFELDTKLINNPIQNLQDVINAMQDLHFQGTLVPNKEAQYPPNLFINPGARLKETPASTGTGPANF